MTTTPVTDAFKTTQSDYFSLELYEQTLHKAKRLDYCFPTVSQLRDGGKDLSRFLLLRHDIDTSPRHAAEMARLEHRLEVQSSYFVLMHSPYYSPSAPVHWDALRTIIAMGFEVGLHYDTNFYEKRGMDALEGVLNDVDALEKILGIKIVSVSQHDPAASTFVRRLNEYYVDAYNHDLINNLCYISDSGFKWRGKQLIDLLGMEDRIHALVHPLTWCFGDLDMAGTYRRIGDQLLSELRTSIEALIAYTNSYLNERDRLDKARAAQYLNAPCNAK